MKTLRRLALITTLLTLLLIAVGASVRAAGAGLGCRDWPQCFENHWLPPADASGLSAADARDYSFAKAWIEYANRLVGVVIGLFIFATGVLAWFVARHRPAILWLLSAAVVMTGFQGWQGGQVVFKELDPRWVTVHLVTALVILVLLARATTDLFGSGWVKPDRLEPRRARMRLAARIALVFVLSQVVLGALVRGTVDLVALEQPTLARPDRLAEVGFIDIFHRQIGALSWFLIAGAAFLAWRSRGGASLAIRRWAAVAFGLGSLQIAFGLGLAYVGLPPALQVLHITSACALVVALDLLQRFAGADLKP
jgi:heme a synthase